MDMNRRSLIQKMLGAVAVVPVVNALTACGSKEQPAAEPAQAPAEPAAQPAAAEPAAGAPAGGEAAAGGGLPEGLPPLTEDDPAASALGYKMDAATVDTAKFPKKADAAMPDQKCANCVLYTDAGHPEYGKCAAFPGKLVKQGGWCNSWAKKA